MMPKNYPIEVCARRIAELFIAYPHAAFYQKWTCGGCGKRLTGNTPNKLFIEGHCEECGYTTDLQKTGCNYAVHFMVGGLSDVSPEGNA